TGRVRAGVAVDKLLIFATAGVAAGQGALSTSFDYRDTGKAFTNTASSNGSASGLLPGFVVGAGGEYAVNDKLSIKAEGMYYRLSGLTVTANGSGSTGLGTPATVQPYSATFTPSGAVFRLGANIRF